MSDNEGLFDDGGDAGDWDNEADALGFEDDLRHDFDDEVEPEPPDFDDFDDGGFERPLLGHGHVVRAKTRQPHFDFVGEVNRWDDRRRLRDAHAHEEVLPTIGHFGIAAGGTVLLAAALLTPGPLFAAVGIGIGGVGTFGGAGVAGYSVVEIARRGWRAMVT